MKLSAIFSNGCIFLRNEEAFIKGTAACGNVITSKILGETYHVTVPTNGLFMVSLGTHGACEDIEVDLVETDREGKIVDSITLHDVCFGEVFLMSGQSNMELPISRTLDVNEEFVKTCDYPYVREFAVPVDYQFGSERDLVAGGEWKKGTGEQIFELAATGFFTGRSLYSVYQVPVGLIRSAAGGSPLQAWMKRDTIMEIGFDCEKEDLLQCEKPGFVEETQKRENAEAKKWYEEASDFTIKDESKTTTVTIPGLWEEGPYKDYFGTLLLTKTFTLNEKPSGKARIYLGSVWDADVTYINGERVGETTYLYPPRKYDFDSSILKVGVNEVRVEMKIYRGVGGFNPGKRYAILTDKEDVSLEGEWKITPIKRLPMLPDVTFFQYKPASTYNAMLAPLRGIKVRAMAWYQGESNAGDPDGINHAPYAKYFNRALEDFRSLMGDPNLPCVFVELPNWADSRLDCKQYDWAIFRVEQQKSLVMNNTAMVTALDLGEWNDLHPQNKKPLGERIAKAIAKLAYGVNVEYTGPLALSAKYDGKNVLVSFCHVRKFKQETITGLEFVMPDSTVKAVSGKIVENVLVVDAPVRPAYIRYAWNNNPENANIFNEVGYPGATFNLEVTN